MKKAKTIGKKTLSVFLAVLMVLTAWVWVAPTEAEAAAGSYYVKISYNVTDTADDYNKTYTGKSSGGDNNVGISLFHKSNNGTGTESEAVWDMQTQMKTSGTNYVYKTITGFPTSIYVYNNNGGVFDAGVLKITKIEIGSSSSATLSTLWAGTISVDSTMNAAIATLDSSYQTTVTDDASVSTTTKGWTYPYANTITWSNTPEAMTCPKSASDTAATQTVAASAKDQYGVQMFDPTWSVKGNNKSDGITVSPTTSSGSTTIRVTSTANIAGTTNSQTGTVTATWSTPSSTGNTSKTSSKTFTINDATYTATFKNHRNANGVLQSDYTTTAQYGVTPTAPTASDYSEGDYDYTFTGWNPTVSGITADTTYTAVYSNGVFVGADYTAVNNAISAADAIKAQYGTEYELKYTLATRVALDNAITSVVTGLGRTRQDDVDGYAQAINDAIAALEPNKFDVIFLDKNGAILLYEKDVEYKEAVTAPSFPDDQKVYYDSTNHYTFTGWDTDEYTSVVDDLVIQPVFSAEAHTFTTSVVPSTCVQKGATKYTCSCGYSYIDGESDYGDHVWETEFTIDLEPTCTVAGSKSIHCSLCDAQKDITVINPLGHNFTSQSVAVEATCGKIGIVTKVCDDCSFCEHSVIPALEHDYKETVVAPTCTTKGYTEYVCQRANCGHSYRDNFTNVVAHSYGAWETVSEAYCGVAGVKKQTCTECGHVNIGSIDALQHNLSGWTDVVERTCTGKGYQVKICSLCNNVIEEQWLDALGHNYVEKTVVAPTCTSKGYTIEECNRGTCGAQRIVNEKAALNHAWTEVEHDADCTHSAYIEHVCGNDASHNYVEYVNGSAALTHNFTGTETIISNATCEENGEKTIQCTRCDATTTVVIPRLGHSYGAWEVVKEATNNEDGKWTRTCSKCNDVEEITIPKGGHVWDNGTQTLAPTCTTTGTMVYKCSEHANCGITIKVTVPAIQHSVATRENPSATCTTEGTVESYCSVCNEVFSSIPAPVKAHNFVAQTAVAPTCTTAGYTPYKCSACSFTYNVFNDAQATGHISWTETGRTDATCTADGSVTYKCDKCDETKTEVLPKTGHNYVEDTSAATSATCKDPATKTYKCNNAGCGDTYTVIDGVQNDNHVWGGWQTIVKATNTSIGYETNTCTTCGKVQVKTIPATGEHVFDKATGNRLAATCTTDGWIEYACSTHTDCGLTSKENVPATGHTQKIVYTAPTCIAEGTSKIVCSVESCKAEIMSTPIPATGIHDFSGEGVITDPGCTTEGEITYTCKTDGCTATKKDKIPAKGHTLTTTVTDAKCGEKGSVVTECKVCNDPTVKTVTELTAKGHIWKDTPESTVDAKCETDGSETYKCENCDATNVVVVPKLGHDWGKWTVTKASTNTEEGEMTRTCSRGCTETVKIPAGEHKLVVDTANSTPATCTTEGKTVYKCEKHTDCGVTLEVTVPVREHLVAVEIQEATCAKKGYIKQYCAYTDCNAVISNETTEKLAHVYVAGTAVDPTCTTSGYTPYTCSSCNDTYNKYDADKPATGHTFDESITANVTITSASCTADGSKTVKCKNCAETKTETLPKLGHTYTKKSETTAGCTTPATEVYECSTCKDTYTKYVSPANGHSWNETWTTVREATDDKNGVEKTICKVCGEEKFRTTEPIGDHEFTETTTPATCTTDGLKTFTCSKHTDCSANYTETIPAKGHTGKIDYTAPTCIAVGYSKIVCNTCGTEMVSETIPVIYHDFSGAGVKTDATCTSDGVMTYTCKTEKCTATKTETIPAKGHDLATTVEDATCTKKGSVKTECSRCGEETLIKELPVIEHTWNSGTETKAATCTADGVKTYTCSVCGATKTETIAKLGHDWGKWTVTKASTNTEEGEMTRTCSRGCEETAEIPAGGHKLVETSRDDATCAKEGSVTYTCNVTHEGGVKCGISVTVPLAKTQHFLETKTEKEASCEEDGLVVTKCTKCKTELVRTILPKKNHMITVTVTDATCTSEGKVVEACANCEYKNETVIAKLNHSYTGTETEITPATCEADGEKTVKCQTCDATTTVIIPKLGHDWNDWDKVDATNDKDGSWTRTCKNNAEHKETVVIPAGGHKLVENTAEYVAPTCNTKGKRVYVCNNPAHTNCTVTVTVELDYAQHTIVKDNKEASCTETGYSKTICSVCDKEFNSVEIPVKAHEYVAGTAVAPTCSTSGYTPYKCSCGDSYKKYDETKPATGHTLTQGASTATCENEGVITLSCANCDYTKNVNVPALGHNYVEDTSAATDATCAAAATKTYKCTRCAASYTVSDGDKTTEHKWGAWTVKESATASSLGYEIRTCNVCGKMEVRTIPATGEHNFNTVIDREDATCTEAGWIDYKCSTHTDCGKTSRVELPATGHTEKHEYKNATCTAEGYSRMVCSVCNDVLSTEEIPVLGHNWNSGNVTNATCNTEGKIVRTCQRTGCKESHTTVIEKNANAHQYETTVTDSTCTTNGTVVTVCKLCGDKPTDKVLPVIEHSWDSGTETKAATCIANGLKTYTCSVCGATKTETIAKLGHAWGKWTVTKASTNADKGVLTRTCSRGCEETAEIPAGGHNLVEISRDDASCTKEGSVTYACNVTHEGNVACGISVTVTLAKTQHVLETTKTDATCDVPGTVITKCKNCDTETITTTIPATGCAWDEGVVTTPASCTTEGLMTFTCAHDSKHQYTATIAKLQHVYEPGKAVEPTCTESGYTPYKCKTCDSSYVILGAEAKGHSFTEKVSSDATCIAGGTLTLKCADCDKTMGTAVPALGHDYQLNSTTTATCAAAATETYKCSRCTSSYTVSVGSKTNAHDFGEWVTVEKASYDSIGYKTRTCKICSKLEVETIPATGAHNLVESKRDNATCTADGKIYFACNSHADCGVTDEVVIPKLGHEEALSYKAATCTEAGYTKIVCSRCGELENKTIAKLDHSFEITEIKNSTCAQTGTISLKCKNCTETKTVEIPVNADTHKFTSTTVAATCKSEGSITVICENGCGYKKITPLDKLQHKWGVWSVKTPSTNGAEGEMTRTCDNGCTETVKIPAGGHAFGKEPDSIIPASCTAEGSATYKCTAHTNCGVEITVKLDKVQHSLVTDIKKATCTEDGHVKVYCEGCEYDKAVDMTIGKLAHSDKVVETKAATCTTAGYTTYECENCHRAFSKLDAQPNGHKYLNEGAVVVTNATCETAGYTTYNCDNCDETHTVSIVAAKGHSWTEWTVEKAATNTEKGLLSRTCINGCGEKETAEIPAGGHSFNTDEPSATTDGTCLVKGTKTFKCSAHSDCGVTITVETEFGAHAWSDWTKVDATNDTDGSWTRECAVCHTEETHVIPKGDHKFGDTPSSTVPATCKKTGTATYNCTTHTNCGVTITVVLEMIQHTAGVDKKDATCTENGYVKTYCTVCGDVISNVELKKTGHVETTTTRQESTCVTPGWEKVICKCGELVSEKELPLIAHNYDANGDGKVDKKDAVFEDGTYTYTCQQAGCGHTITEDADDVYKVRFFDAAGNQIGETQNVRFGESAVAPAAPEKKADGTYHYEFSVWDRNYSEITSDLDVYPTYEKELHYGGEATCKDKALCDKCGTAYGGYDDTKHVMASKSTPATCEKDGVINYYCTLNCGYGYSEKIQRLNHNYGEWTVVQQGTCVKEHIQSRKCQNYGCDATEEYSTYKNHSWILEPAIAPTCTTVGYTEFKYCTVCNLQLDRQEVAKLSHNDRDGNGYCDYCGTSQGVPKCNCMCHSTGFMKIIYSIVRFFWIITKSSPSCSCGARHY